MTMRLTSLGSRCGRPSTRPWIPHRSNGGRRPTTAPGRAPCTCCGVVTAGCSPRTGLAGAMRTRCLIAGRTGPRALAGAVRTCCPIVGCQDPRAPAGAMRTRCLVAGRTGPRTLAGAVRACCPIVRCQDPRGPAGAVRTRCLVAGRTGPTGSAGAVRTCCLVVGRSDPTAPAVATKGPPGDSVPTRRPATSPVTGTDPTGPLCRRAGSTATARPWLTDPDPAPARGLVSAHRPAWACRDNDTCGRRDRM